MIEEHGPICDKCDWPINRWPINHPVVQRIQHPGQTHACFTDDPMAR